jgi:glycosyltransferase involved in cell wall biosynthesis
MTAPAFTVVMAARDTRATVGSAIRSVLAQTRGDFELVVVDDGSRDGTPDAVREFAGDPRVRLLERPPEGVAAARGTGIAAGSAPLVALIDSDDLWMPSYLATMGAALDADPGAGFAYTDAWFLEEDRRRIRRASAMAFQRPPEPPPATAAELFDALMERNFIFNAVTLRREAIEAVGPPDVRLRAMIDWEWWLRLTARGQRGVRVPGRLAVYRQRPASISKAPVLVASGQRDLWRIVADEYDLPEDVRERLRARSLAFDAEVAALEGRRRLAGVRWRFRRGIASVRRRLTYDRDYHREPPAELREAFGDLRSV